MTTNDIQDHIDSLLLANKVVAGTPMWENGPRPGEEQKRLVAPLSIDGEICDLRLIIDAYPYWFEKKFTIMLNFERVICRLDYAASVVHANGLLPPQGVSTGLIEGPHFHSWQANRHLGTPSRTPEKLSFAEPLPSNVQGFQNAFRWFCGGMNIDCVDGVPETPKSDRLI